MSLLVQIAQLTGCLGLTLLSYLSQLATCYLPGQLGKGINMVSHIPILLHYLPSWLGNLVDIDLPVLLCYC